MLWVKIKISRIREYINNNNNSGTKTHKKTTTNQPHLIKIANIFSE